MIEFRLDPTGGVPPYLQLVRQVEDALRLAYLIPGDQLPRVKDVVAALAINPNTVLKAYRELELRGLATGRPGVGTFVEASPAAALPLRDLRELGRGLAGWLAEAAAAGLDEAAMRALFRSTLQNFVRRRAEEELGA